MENNKDFARSLSLLRRERGVSQRMAAKELGISQALLSHYENGAREPGLAFVRRACDYYNVSADFLLGRSMSRDGTNIIEAEELYDASAEKGNVLRGSVAAMLNKKLLINSMDLLFDLLGRVGSKGAIAAASAYLGTPSTRSSATSTAPPAPRTRAFSPPPRATSRPAVPTPT